MATTIKKQVASINAAAAHFALHRYLTNTTFSKASNRAECCIYFHDLLEKERLIKAMQCFADEGDEIVFNEYEGINPGKFYTIQLIKELAL